MEDYSDKNQMWFNEITIRKNEIIKELKDKINLLLMDQDLDNIKKWLDIYFDDLKKLEVYKYISEEFIENLTRYYYQMIQLFIEKKQLPLEEKTFLEVINKDRIITYTENVMLTLDCENDKRLECYNWLIMHWWDIEYINKLFNEEKSRLPRFIYAGFMSFLNTVRDNQVGQYFDLWKALEYTSNCDTRITPWKKYYLHTNK